MKVGEFRQKTTLKGSGARVRPLLPGQRVVVTESNAREMVVHSFRAEEAPPPLRPWRNDAPLDGKSLLLIRPGGVGDLLMMTPAIRLLRERYPTARIDACAFPKVTSAVEGNPHLDRVIEYPPLLETFEGYDYHVDFEGVIENNPEAETTPGIDLMAGWMGLDLEGHDRVPVLRLSDEERWRARYKPMPLREKRGPWVMIQAAASSRIRTWPQQRAAEVALGLIRAGAEVFVTGHPSEWGRFRNEEVRNGRTLVTYVPAPRGLHNLTGQTGSIRDLAAIMEKMDLVISPDSSAVHLAAALDKPNIALYGPFPSLLRVSYYPRCLAVQGEAECAPCFMHGLKPTCGNEHCLALDRIEPKHVIMLALGMLSDSEQLSASIEREAAGVGA